MTKDEAGQIIQVLRARKVAQDAATVVSVRQNAIKAINSYGIETLRREASKAGMPGAWKGPKADALRQYLISKI